MRVMYDGKTVMVDDKSSAHQYKLKGCIVVKGVVMDSNITKLVFYVLW